MRTEKNKKLKYTLKYKYMHSMCKTQTTNQHKQKGNYGRVGFNDFP